MLSADEWSISGSRVPQTSASHLESMGVAIVHYPSGSGSMGTYVCAVN